MGVTSRALSGATSSKGKHVTIDGALTIYTVLDIQKDLSEIFADCDMIRLQLGQVESCDTAGVQLLLAFIKEMAIQDKVLKIKEISSCIVEAATAIGTTIMTNI